MDTIASLKNTCDDFSVEFEVLPPIDLSTQLDEKKRYILQELSDIEEQQDSIQQEIDKLNAEIGNLTNTADIIDYTVAVASGILTGFIDIMWVGEFSLDNANTWGNDKTNNFVIKIAQKQGYSGDDLYGAVKFLENKYPIVSDKATNKFGGGLQHHLRDFSHHPTPIGLLFSLLTQFTSKCYGTDTAGIFKIVDIDPKGLVLIGKNFPEKITFGVTNWFFHMVSDMAGSSSSILEGKAGTGLPGPLLSLLKEVSVLPIFKKMNKNGYKEFSVWISKVFNGTQFGKRDKNGKITQAVKFDLRTEIGVMHELGKQTIPVIINECIVRGFYFIRHLCMELKDNHVKHISNLKDVNIHNILPFKNRTITRMLTISSGTFTAVDMAGAAIETALKNPGACTTPYTFFQEMILKVNFVGIGRFAMAFGTDVAMGIKKYKKRNERIQLYTEFITYSGARLYYKQANMWLSAYEAGKTIEEAFILMEKSSAFYIESMNDISEHLKVIEEYVPEINKKNHGLIEDIEDILEWG